MLIKEYINHFIKFSEEEWSAFYALLQEVNIKKGEHIYNESDIFNSIYFINKGVVRSYKLEDDGKDFTWSFHCLTMDTIEHRMLMDAVVVDYVSFSKEVPEVLAYEALADSTLLKISKEDLEKLYKKYPIWGEFDKILAQEAYATLRDRTLSLLTKDAKSRLQELLSYYPYVFKKDVKIEHIASYLGITRQTLNRLRLELEII